jgi:ABC-type glycerol-3-phosphate transport system substrate-binding protein
VTGCSNKDKQKQVKNVAMGRYIEKSVTMPEGVEAGEEYAAQLIKNPKGEIELYTRPWKNKGKEHVIQYTLEGDKWVKSVPKWMNIKGGDFYVTYAPDGTKYIAFCKNKPSSIKVKILKSKDNVNGENVVIDDYKKDADYSKIVYNFNVLEDNSILIDHIDSFSLYKDGKEKISFKIGGYDYALNGNNLLGMNENMDSGVIIDVTTGKTISQVPINESENGIYTYDAKGNWYMVNNAGIHRMVKDGNSWETILDGALASMSMPSMWADAVVRGDKDDFYILYSDSNGLTKMKYYVYDKNTPTTPSKTLTVVSLEENYTVRQAIVDYQHKNQDVKVEYKALMSDEDGSTSTDYIKKINTELLAGKGADILVLDGMPVDSYIEKGVLSDLSDIITPLEKKGELLSNIVDPYKKDGKIYSIPIRYDLLVAYGYKDAVASADSLYTLADYVKNSSEIPLLGDKGLTYSDLTKNLFRLYSNGFLTEKGFNREELIHFLEVLKLISDQTKAVKVAPKKSGDRMDEVAEYWNEPDSQLLFDKKASLQLADIWSMDQTYAPAIVVNIINGVFTTVNHEFMPSGLVGINNASKQKDVAGEFMQTLFAESVQKIQLGDGFPVNSKALVNFGMEYDDMIGGGNGFTVEQTSKEEMQKILDLCKTVTTPVQVDEVLFDMLNKEIIPYLSGESDSKTTADQIIEKAKTYLQE